MGIKGIKDLKLSFNQPVNLIYNKEINVTSLGCGAWFENFEFLSFSSLFFSSGDSLNTQIPCFNYLYIVSR